PPARLRELLSQRGRPADRPRQRRLRARRAMSAIRSLTARPFDLPLERPLETSNGVMHTAPVVLVDITTGDGLTGRSYLRTYTPVGLRALAGLLDDLAPVLAGLPADPAQIRERLSR